MGFSNGSVVKNPPAKQETQETWVRYLGGADPLEEKMAIHSSILVWEITWTEQPGGLQSIESWGIGYNWNDLAHSHASTSLHMVWNVTENLILLHWVCFPTKQELHDGSVVKNLPANAGDSGSVPETGKYPEEGNGNPLQYPCLENAMDRGAWRATIHGVTKESDTVIKQQWWPQALVCNAWWSEVKVA